MNQEARGALFDQFVVGGLIDDADITLRSARFVPWDYNGTVNPPVLGLKLEMVDGEGNVHTDHLSAGDLKFFVPSGDGKKAIPVGKQEKLNINTNAVAFLVSLMNADTRGELTAKIKTTDDISIIDNSRLHIVRKAQPKRPNIVAPEVVPGQAKPDPRQLTVEKVLAYPWETAAPTPVAQAAAPAVAQVQAAAPAAVAAPAGAAAAQSATLLTQLIAEAGGSIKVGQIAGQVFKLMKDNPAAERNAVLGTILTPAFLGSDLVKGNGLVYDPQAGTVGFAG